MSNDPEVIHYKNLLLNHTNLVDFDSRPLVVVNACFLPSPVIINYDELLHSITSDLDEFVMNDYSAVLLCSGVEHKPSWNFIYKCYKSIGRDYKKNLKALYVVHPNVWIKFLLSLMKNIVSKKFSKKLFIIPTLTDLAAHVPYAQLSIPHKVTEYDKTVEPTIILPPPLSPVDPLVFGKRLSTLAECMPSGITDDLKYIPKIVSDIVQHILDDGTTTEGIFRISPSSSELQKARLAYDMGSDVKLSDYCIHVSCSLLKLFFRQLPVSLIPDYLNNILTESKSPFEVLLDLLKSLPKEHKLLLLYMLDFLHKLVKPSVVEKTKMTVDNLVIVFSVNFVSEGKGSNLMIIVQHFSPVLKAGIMEYEKIKLLH
jgi:hypothetical protein